MSKHSGTSQLPLARVKRIIKEDKDVGLCSNEAVFLISIATELFIEFFANNAVNYAVADKRKTIQYKDLANAVSKIDQLEFLSDVIPKTIPLRKALMRQKEAKEEEGEEGEEEGEEGEKQEMMVD
ncbi:uncharacterized protein VTP21DRAFT_11082 [Calcarisporiella thermophila]|uniref:uncharacterized protein n=1 Tax=Calcarisporiella thermophila TaxID=911321 RepID=UPI0037435593